MLDAILTGLQPFLIEIIIGFIGAGVLWLARKLPAALGSIIELKWRETEKLLRDSLHMAVVSGLQDAASRGLKGQGALEHAIQHMHRSVPDAIRRLEAPDNILTAIIRSKDRIIGSIL